MNELSDAMANDYRNVLRFVRRLTRSSVDAEDLAQDVFLSVAENLAREGARTESPELAWLYTVARRRLVDQLRRRRLQTVPLELAVESTGEVYGTAVARTLRDGLASMSEGQRIVVSRRLLEGWSFAEIASELGLTEEACRMRFMRGLEHLRDSFEKEGLRP